ncbi:MAG: DUF302 domain-containing protein [Candidatus Latescibacterota bacterium]|nr:MAG: DUF302 domain-containing protein [Candidatus Latescibacterota bacterium]
MYGYSRTTELDFGDAVNRICGELEKEGFGILTEIDVKATLKKKLDVDFRRYVILGACNPPFAHRALAAEIDIGLLMPCNVIVYENDGGGSTIAAMNAGLMADLTGNTELVAVADEVNAKLKRAVDAV